MLVDPLCSIKSRVNAAIYQEISEGFTLPSADKLHQDANFLFQQASAPVHSAKTTTEWFSDHLISASDWAANLPDLKPSENLQSTCQEEDEKTHTDDLKAAIKTTPAVVTPQQRHKLTASMSCCTNAVIGSNGM